ncbi:MAG: hypothetical protein KKD44_17310 [Proteobacteria bacterium]|nr:hypothetical protein [Pseudomonadota bacterium]
MQKKENDKTTKKGNKEHWEAMKKMTNWRGVLCTVPETYGFIDLTKEIDITVKKLRNGVSNRISMKQAAPMFDALNDATLLLVQTVEIIAQTLGYNKYRTPRLFQQMQETHAFDNDLEQKMNALKIRLSSESKEQRDFETH